MDKATMITRYGQRVGLAQLPAPDESGLAQLQLAQRRAIPFENIDVCLRRVISLTPDDIADKLVDRRRGGYCFEQNLLLSSVLNAMGVAHFPVLARVWLGNVALPPLTHLAIIAHDSEGDWLMDAGFGGGYCPPVRLFDGSSVIAPDQSCYRLNHETNGSWLLTRVTDSGAVKQYSFMRTPAAAVDIALSNHWVSTHPSSRFVQNLIVNRIDNHGHSGITNHLLTAAASPDASLAIESATQLHDVLTTRFDMSLSTAEVETLWRDFLAQKAEG